MVYASKILAAILFLRISNGPERSKSKPFKIRMSKHSDFNGIRNPILSHQYSDELGFRFSDYDCAVQHPPGTQCQRQPEDFRPRAEHNRTCPGSGRSSPIFRPSCSDRSEAWQEWIWWSPGGLDRGLGALLRPRLVEREGEWHLVEKKLVKKIEHCQSNLGIKIRGLGPSAETRVPKY